MLATTSAWTGFGGLSGLAAPLLLFIAMAGLVVANSIADAMTACPTRAGAASALVGSIQYGSGIFRSALIGALADGTPWPLGAAVALFSPMCGGLGLGLRARDAGLNRRLGAVRPGWLHAE
jgi:DHA1 family bicyclomycin/chloramphenicol resistance-like MFS transporter